MHVYQSYMDLMSGDGDLESVRESVEMTERYSQFFNEDAASVNPPEANQKIMNGDAGFYHQGNWMAGGYNANDLTYKEDWGWIAFPGTEDMYTLHMDAFVYPHDNPSPDASVKWHRYVGSQEAQVNFNKHKGAIPLREVATRTMEGKVADVTVGCRPKRDLVPDVEGTENFVIKVFRLELPEGEEVAEL
jgi:glucose/mannose transport system substrate-binding protein